MTEKPGFFKKPGFSDRQSMLCAAKPSERPLISRGISNWSTRTPKQGDQNVSCIGIATLPCSSSAAKMCFALSGKRKMRTQGHRCFSKSGSDCLKNSTDS